ncbi:MAG: VOC family protein, partial [Actinomycetota bacterium]
REAGYDPGPISDMSRAKPDGSILSWRLTRGISAGGALPFAIDWGDADSPAVSLPSMGGLVSLTISHPDPAVRASAEALDVGVAVQDGPVGLVAVVDTPNGSVEIR